MEIKSLKVLIVGCGQLGFSIVKNADSDVFKLYGFSRSLRKSPASIEMHQVDILKTEAIDVIKLINPEIIIYAVSADTQSIESYQDHYVVGLKKNVRSDFRARSLQASFLCFKHKSLWTKND